MKKLPDSPASYRPAASGVYLPPLPVAHREDEYDSEGFSTLHRMQRRHFWYRGRHRFLYHAVDRELRRRSYWQSPKPDIIDLGGGCGGWVEYLARHCPERLGEIAIADSSLLALELAAGVVPAGVRRYQIDLVDLQWQDRWDVAFLLDVLEHIPDDERVLIQIRESLRPGGTLFVTTPALQAFWSYNDNLVRHVRRYSRADFSSLAARCGFRLRDCRYFMFFLSPLLYLSRRSGPSLESMTQDQMQAHFSRTHRVPVRPLNTILSWVFGAETPLGHLVPFPWGTSIMGVFEKPEQQ
jgi:2-polyprenyl-3-methyl-5-hydroxy-6-metoxy-1,4-benzoquinol methylase